VPALASSEVVLHLIVVPLHKNRRRHNNVEVIFLESVLPQHQNFGSDTGTVHAFQLGSYIYIYIYIHTHTHMVLL
jgi:hypothetical protein